MSFIKTITKICHRCCGSLPAVWSLVGAPVERGGSVGQYPIGGEGAGKWGDGEVAERARLDSVLS
jgi:hypothetical protein